jgi:ATP-dependent DNA helicase RecG
MTRDLDALRRLIHGDEGQYFDRKSLFEGPPGRKTARNRKAVRDEVAHYVAAFANADGGTLVLGVEDDGTVTGCPYQDAKDVETLCDVPAQRLSPAQTNTRGTRVELDGNSLIVFDVRPAARAVRVTGDGYPRREGDEVHQSSEELINRLKDEGFVLSPEARTADRATIADLDGARIEQAIVSSGLDTSPAEFLVRRRLADRRDDELVLRQGAIWLFARAPESIAHPNLGVRVFRVHGTEQRHGAQRNVQDYPWVEGNVLAILEQTQALLTTLIRSSAKLHDLFFREVPEYPAFAWQEALVNALAHRDYSIESSSVEVWLYDDRLEIKSPGALLASVHVEDLRERKRVHESRNPRIARILTELGIMRQQGEGIPRMIEEMELSWLRAPELESSARDFTVTLYNEPIFHGADQAWTHFVRQLPLDVRQKRALVAFHDRTFQSGDYQELNRVDRDTAYREMQDLEHRRLLRAEGTTKARRYAVDPSALPKAPKSKTPLAGLVERMKETGRITNTDVRDALGLSRMDARKLLARWVEGGAVELKGERRGAHYVASTAWPPAEPA